ncbi:hypothetical protein AMAG_12804 [Allomyces macrogynus ATCC 38327]|uniref:G domain-containing protein n=1 Tax=Allomyces macrogynus (strain ATCC 38327) TaxID=578462 RepID=A0A0L0T1Z0_ALLM3|nr:hypothetical protein AMAG_12804 [Allomyces macrogynus ATCC 38327]|eukprot:KNE68640.1 hypothetical protein AMAG_12804 [Allomyces macrogynus ATCC 38327]
MTTTSLHQDPEETVIVIGSAGVGTSTIINSHVDGVDATELSAPASGSDRFDGLNVFVAKGVEYVVSSGISGLMKRAHAARIVCDYLRKPHGAKVIFVVCVDKETKKLRESDIILTHVVVSAFQNAAVEFGVVVNKVPDDADRSALRQQVVGTIKTDTCHPKDIVFCPLVPDLADAKSQSSPTAFAEVADLIRDTPVAKLEPLDDCVSGGDANLPSINVAIGNPGSGKSTLINSVARECVTKAGVNAGAGIQHNTLLRFPIDGVTWIDTPGLSDITHRTRAAALITEALQHEKGCYRLIFVVTTEAGRVRPEDLATMTIVLNAIHKKDVPYGVIVNKLSKRLHSRILNDADFYNKFACSLNSGPYSTKDIFLALEVDDARDAEDYILPDVAMKSVLEFINGIPSITMQPNDVSAISATDFDEQESRLQAVVDKMIAENAKEREKMHKMHEEAMEQQRETFKRLQADLERQRMEAERQLELANQNAEVGKAERQALQQQVKEMENRKPEPQQQEQQEPQIIQVLKFLDQQERRREEERRRREVERGQVKDSGCFAGSVLVQLSCGRLVPVSSVRIGDLVAVAPNLHDEPSGKQLFEPVLEFFNYDPLTKAALVSLDVGVDQAGPLVLTGNHFVWAAVSDSPAIAPQFTRARHVSVGMYLVLGDGGRRRVNSIGQVVECGVFSPVTASGTIVANGVVASTYAKPTEFADIKVPDDAAHKLMHEFVEERLLHSWVKELQVDNAADVAAAKMSAWDDRVAAASAAVALINGQSEPEQGGDHEQQQRLELEHPACQALKVEARQHFLAMRA